MNQRLKSNQVKSINQSTNRPINQSTNQSINQSIKSKKIESNEIESN